MSAEDSEAFERHVDGCQGCATAVREFAGIPCLLATVPAELASSALAGEAPQPSTTRLPSLLATARRRRRRFGWLTGAGWTAAAAACLALVLVVALPGGQPVQPSPTPVRSPMTALVAVPIHGAVALEQVAWGTRIDLRCGYDQVINEGMTTIDYVLVVLDRKGRVWQACSWAAASGKTYEIQGGIALSRTEIQVVEVRTLDGKPVPRWRP